MDGELKTFEELLKLMPSGWEQKARELGALNEKWLKWLCGNIFRGGGLRGEKPQWLEGRRVCLTDASDEPVHGSKKADYRLHYVVDLFTLEVVEST